MHSERRRKELLRATHSIEYTSSTSASIADNLRREIDYYASYNCQTRKFVDDIRKKLYMLHDYNAQVDKVTYWYPTSTELNHLLVRYVALEYYVLYKSKYTRDFENQVQQRVFKTIMCFLTGSCRLTGNSMMEDRKLIFDEALKIFIHFADVEKDRFPAKILRNILNALGIVDISSANSGRSLDVNNPSLMRLKEYLRDSDYGSDDDSSGSPSEANEIIRLSEDLHRRKKLQDESSLSKPQVKLSDSISNNGVLFTTVENSTFIHNNSSALFKTEEEISSPSNTFFSSKMTKIISMSEKNIDQDTKPILNKEIDEYECIPTNFDFILDKWKGSNPRSNSLQDYFPSASTQSLISSIDTRTLSQVCSDKSSRDSSRIQEYSIASEGDDDTRRETSTNSQKMKNSEEFCTSVFDAATHNNIYNRRDVSQYVEEKVNPAGYSTEHCNKKPMGRHVLKIGIPVLPKATEEYCDSNSFVPEEISNSTVRQTTGESIKFQMNTFSETVDYNQIQKKSESNLEEGTSADSLVVTITKIDKKDIKEMENKRMHDETSYLQISNIGLHDSSVNVHNETSSYSNTIIQNKSISSLQVADKLVDEKITFGDLSYIEKLSFRKRTAFSDLDSPQGMTSSVGLMESEKCSLDQNTPKFTSEGNIDQVPASSHSCHTFDKLCGKSYTKNSSEDDSALQLPDKKLGNIKQNFPENLNISNYNKKCNIENFHLLPQFNLCKLASLQQMDENLKTHYLHSNTDSDVAPQLRLEQTSYSMTPRTPRSENISNSSSGKVDLKKIDSEPDAKGICERIILNSSIEGEVKLTPQKKKTNTEETIEHITYNCKIKNTIGTVSDEKNEQSKAIPTSIMENAEHKTSTDKSFIQVKELKSVAYKIEPEIFTNSVDAISDDINSDLSSETTKHKVLSINHEGSESVSKTLKNTIQKSLSNCINTSHLSVSPKEKDDTSWELALDSENCIVERTNLKSFVFDITEEEKNSIHTKNIELKTKTATSNSHSDYTPIKDNVPINQAPQHGNTINKTETVPTLSNNIEYSTELSRLENPHHTDDAYETDVPLKKSFLNKTMMCSEILEDVTCDHKEEKLDVGLTSLNIPIIDNSLTETTSRKDDCNEGVCTILNANTDSGYKSITNSSSENKPQEINELNSSSHLKKSDKGFIENSSGSDNITTEIFELETSVYKTDLDLTAEELKVNLLSDHVAKSSEQKDIRSKHEKIYIPEMTLFDHNQRTEKNTSDEVQILGQSPPMQHEDKLKSKSFDVDSGLKSTPQLATVSEHTAHTFEPKLPTVLVTEAECENESTSEKGMHCRSTSHTSSSSASSISVIKADKVANIDFKTYSSSDLGNIDLTQKTEDDYSNNSHSTISVVEKDIKDTISTDNIVATNTFQVEQEATVLPEINSNKSKFKQSPVLNSNVHKNAEINSTLENILQNVEGEVSLNTMHVSEKQEVLLMPKSCTEHKFLESVLGNCPEHNKADNDSRMLSTNEDRNPVILIQEGKTKLCSNHVLEEKTDSSNDNSNVALTNKSGTIFESSAHIFETQNSDSVVQSANKNEESPDYSNPLESSGPETENQLINSNEDKKNDTNQRSTSMSECMSTSERTDKLILNTVPKSNGKANDTNSITYSLSDMIANSEELDSDVKDTICENLFDATVAVTVNIEDGPESNSELTTGSEFATKTCEPKAVKASTDEEEIIMESTSEKAMLSLCSTNIAALEFSSVDIKVDKDTRRVSSDLETASSETVHYKTSFSSSENIDITQKIQGDCSNNLNLPKQNQVVEYKTVSTKENSIDVTDIRDTMSLTSETTSENTFQAVLETEIIEEKVSSAGIKPQLQVNINKSQPTVLNCKINDIESISPVPLENIHQNDLADNVTLNSSFDEQIGSMQNNGNQHELQISDSVRMNTNFRTKILDNFTLSEKASAYKRGYSNNSTDGAEKESKLKIVPHEETNRQNDNSSIALQYKLDTFEAQEPDYSRVQDENKNHFNISTLKESASKNISPVSAHCKMKNSNITDKKVDSTLESTSKNKCERYLQETEKGNLTTTLECKFTESKSNKVPISSSVRVSKAIDRSMKQKVGSRKNTHPESSFDASIPLNVLQGEIPSENTLSFEKSNTVTDNSNSSRAPKEISPNESCKFESSSFILSADKNITFETENFQSQLSCSAFTFQGSSHELHLLAELAANREQVKITQDKRKKASASKKKGIDHTTLHISDDSHKSHIPKTRKSSLSKSGDYFNKCDESFNELTKQKSICASKFSVEDLEQTNFMSKSFYSRTAQFKNEVAKSPIRPDVLSKKFTVGDNIEKRKQTPPIRKKRQKNSGCKNDEIFNLADTKCAAHRQKSKTLKASVDSNFDSDDCKPLSLRLKNIKRNRTVKPIGGKRHQVSQNTNTNKKGVNNHSFKEAIENNIERRKKIVKKTKLNKKSVDEIQVVETQHYEKVRENNFDSYNTKYVEDNTCKKITYEEKVENSPKIQSPRVAVISQLTENSWGETDETKVNLKKSEPEISEKHISSQFHSNIDEALELACESFAVNCSTDALNKASHEIYTSGQSPVDLKINLSANFNSHFDNSVIKSEDKCTMMVHKSIDNLSNTSAGNILTISDCTSAKINSHSSISKNIHYSEQNKIASNKSFYAGNNLQNENVQTHEKAENIAEVVLSAETENVSELLVKKEEYVETQSGTSVSTSAENDIENVDPSDVLNPSSNSREYAQNINVPKKKVENNKNVKEYSEVTSTFNENGNKEINKNKSPFDEVLYNTVEKACSVKETEYTKLKEVNITDSIKEKCDASETDEEFIQCKAQCRDSGKCIDEEGKFVELGSHEAKKEISIYSSVNDVQRGENGEINLTTITEQKQKGDQGDIDNLASGQTDKEESCQPKIDEKNEETSYLKETPPDDIHKQREKSSQQINENMKDISGEERPIKKSEGNNEKSCEIHNERNFCLSQEEEEDLQKQIDIVMLKQVPLLKPNKNCEINLICPLENEEKQYETSRNCLLKKSEQMFSILENTNSHKEQTVTNSTQGNNEDSKSELNKMPEMLNQTENIDDCEVFGFNYSKESNFQIRNLESVEEMTYEKNNRNSLEKSSQNKNMSVSVPSRKRIKTLGELKHFDYPKLEESDSHKSLEYKFAFLANELGKTLECVETSSKMENRFCENKYVLDDQPLLEKSVNLTEDVEVVVTSIINNTQIKDSGISKTKELSFSVEKMLESDKKRILNEVKSLEKMEKLSEVGNTIHKSEICEKNPLKDNRSNINILSDVKVDVLIDSLDSISQKNSLEINTEKQGSNVDTVCIKSTIKTSQGQSDTSEYTEFMKKQNRTRKDNVKSLSENSNEKIKKVIVEEVFSMEYSGTVATAIRAHQNFFEPSVFHTQLVPCNLGLYTCPVDKNNVKLPKDSTRMTRGKKSPRKQARNVISDKNTNTNTSTYNDPTSAELNSEVLDTSDFRLSGSSSLTSVPTQSYEKHNRCKKRKRTFDESTSSCERKNQRTNIFRTETHSNQQEEKKETVEQGYDSICRSYTNEQNILPTTSYEDTLRKSKRKQSPKKIQLRNTLEQTMNEEIPYSENNMETIDKTNFAENSLNISDETISKHKETKKSIEHIVSSLKSSSSRDISGNSSEIEIQKQIRDDKKSNDEIKVSHINVDHIESVEDIQEGNHDPNPSKLKLHILKNKNDTSEESIPSGEKLTIDMHSYQIGSYPSVTESITQPMETENQNLDDKKVCSFKTPSELYENVVAANERCKPLCQSNLFFSAEKIVTEQRSTSINTSEIEEQMIFCETEITESSDEKLPSDETQFSTDRTFDESLEQQPVSEQKLKVEENILMDEKILLETHSSVSDKYNTNGEEYQHKLHLDLCKNEPCLSSNVVGEINDVIVTCSNSEMQQSSGACEIDVSSQTKEIACMQDLMTDLQFNSNHLAVHEAIKHISSDNVNTNSSFSDSSEVNIQSTNGNTTQLAETRIQEKPISSSCQSDMFSDSRQNFQHNSVVKGGDPKPNMSLFGALNSNEFDFSIVNSSDLQMFLDDPEFFRFFYNCSDVGCEVTVCNTEEYGPNIPTDPMMGSQEEPTKQELSINETSGSESGQLLLETRVLDLPFDDLLFLYGNDSRQLQSNLQQPSAEAHLKAEADSSLNHKAARNESTEIKRLKISQINEPQIPPSNPEQIAGIPKSLDDFNDDSTLSVCKDSKTTNIDDSSKKLESKPKYCEDSNGRESLDKKPVITDTKITEKRLKEPIKPSMTYRSTPLRMHRNPASKYAPPKKTNVENEKNQEKSKSVNNSQSSEINEEQNDKKSISKVEIKKNNLNHVNESEISLLSRKSYLSHHVTENRSRKSETKVKKKPQEETHEEQYSSMYDILKLNENKRVAARDKNYSESKNDDQPAKKSRKRKHFNKSDRNKDIRYSPGYHSRYTNPKDKISETLDMENKYNKSQVKKMKTNPGQDVIKSESYSDQSSSSISQILEFEPQKPQEFVSEFDKLKNKSVSNSCKWEESHDDSDYTLRERLRHHHTSSRSSPTKYDASFSSSRPSSEGSSDQHRDNYKWSSGSQGVRTDRGHKWNHSSNDRKKNGIHSRRESSKSQSKKSEWNNGKSGFGKLFPQRPFRVGKQEPVTRSEYERQHNWYRKIDERFPL